MNTLAPIALFVYNRPEHVRKTVEALRANTLAAESELFIFSDGAKNAEDAAAVKEIRKYLETISGFQKITITPRSENWGLSKSVISGVTEMVDKHGKVIVLEDDLVTSPYFLRYMNDGLNKFENSDQVISIHGYLYPIDNLTPPVFFLRGADCWGWATWKNKWSLFRENGNELLEELKKNNQVDDFNFYNTFGYSAMLQRQIEGKNDSWAIRWYASAYLANKLTLWPGHSLVENIGQFDGTHKGTIGFKSKILLNTPINIPDNLPIEENKKMRQNFAIFFKKPVLKHKYLKLFRLK